NDIYLVTNDDRDRDVDLEEHGQHENDPPAERFVRALARDGAKTTAVEERLGLRSRPAGRTLSELWADRDGRLNDASLAVGCDDLELRRLERAIASRRSEEHTSELQSRSDLVCRLLLEKKKGTRR